MKVAAGTRLPDFFIIGGVKCGTTSLYRYIGQHPGVYMPRVKEPGFFVYEGWKGPLPTAGAVATLEAYAALFEEAPPDRVVGEASPIYLYHGERTAPRIRALAPNARMIVSLRNPIQRAYAQYRMAVAEGYEDAPDFDAALDAEPGRVAAGARMIFHYANQSLYYDRTRRFIDTFGREHVHIHLFADFQASPLRVVEELFTFLGVDSRFVPSIRGAFNSSRGVRSRRLRKFLRRPGALERAFGRVVPVRMRRRVKTRLMKLNIEPHHVPESARVRLAELFREDVLKLSELLDRDLTRWLR